VQTETIVFCLGNKIKFSSAVLIFYSRSTVALPIWYKRHIANVSVTPVIIANLAYMNIKKHGELL